MFLVMTNLKKGGNMETLGYLEIQILLHCDVGNFTKTDLSQIARRKYSLTEKQKAIRSLIIKDLLIEKVLPKIGTTRAPVFYCLTDNGKKWVKEYKRSYPIK